MIDDDPTTPLRSALRRRFMGVALAAAFIGLTVGLVLVYAFSHSTATKVQVVQRNSRCNAGDLYACRVVAQHIRTACAPHTLAAVPDRLRGRERQRCGIVGLAAGVTVARRAATNRRTARRHASTAVPAPASPTSSSPAPRTVARPPTRTPPHRHRSPAQPAPPVPSPAPPSPAPATRPPPSLITVPQGVPCVPLPPLVGCS